MLNVSPLRGEIGNGEVGMAKWAIGRGGIFILVLLVLGVAGVGGYNSLVALDQAVQALDTEPPVGLSTRGEHAFTVRDTGEETLGPELRP